MLEGAEGVVQNLVGDIQAFGLKHHPVAPFGQFLQLAQLTAWFGYAVSQSGIIMVYGGGNPCVTYQLAKGGLLFVVQPPGKGIAGR